MVVMRNQIGSRPPRCQRRCSSCGHCEAVQVPIVPQLHSHRTSHFYAAPTVEYSRGDYISNYKPMTWKCKCGNAIFNPWLMYKTNKQRVWEQEKITFFELCIWHDQFNTLPLLLHGREMICRVVFFFLSLSLQFLLFVNHIERSNYLLHYFAA